MQDLLIELLRHEDAGYGRWNRGMRARVVEALSPGAQGRVQVDREWRTG